jgi:hypothetical protein
MIHYYFFLIFLLNKLTVKTCWSNLEFISLLIKDSIHSTTRNEDFSGTPIFRHSSISCSIYTGITLKRKFDNRTTQHVLINHTIHSTYLSQGNILTSISFSLRINNVVRGGDNYPSFFSGHTFCCMVIYDT